MIDVAFPRRGRGRIKGSRTKYSGRIPDVRWVDPVMAALFTAIGRHGLFRQVASWEFLDDRPGDKDRSVWAQGAHRGFPDVEHGRDHRRLGGFLTLDGCGTLRAIRSVAGTGPVAGKLIALAVAEGDDAGTDASGRFASSVAWGANNGPPPGRRSMAERTAGLAEQCRRLRLSWPAEQALWAIHHQLLEQRSGTILLPDVMLAQLRWGAVRERWPSGWRGELLATLDSLVPLQVAVTDLKRGWPDWRRISFNELVRGVEDLRRTRPDEDDCRPACPLFGLGLRHHHLAVGVGSAFSAVLARFDDRRPGTSGRSASRSRPSGRKGTSCGAPPATIPVSLPVAVLGCASWAGLARGERQILQAILGEVTRGRGRRSSGHPARARVIEGRRVPGPDVRSEVECPLLEAGRQYVAFGGNGCRPGMGYLIVGTRGTGWLAKCGYLVPDSFQDGRRVIGEFLRTLGRVAGRFGLTVVGLQPRRCEWLGLDALLRLPRSRAGMEVLLATHLRVYGAPDYLRRLRDDLAERGDFTSIPGGHDEPISSPASSEPSDPRSFFERTGLTQSALAAMLGVSQPFISQVTTGTSPCPGRLRERLEALIDSLDQPDGGRVGV